MRRLMPVALLAVSIAVVGCSSGASPAATPVGAATEAPAASSAPAATPAAATLAPTETPAAATPEPSVDNSAFGSQYAQISSELQAELSKITASMATATTPEALGEAYKEYAAATRKAIAAYRAIDWPAPISGDMDKLLTDEEELIGIFEKMMSDPSATADQQRMAEIEAELPAIAQRIAAYFGVTVP